MMDARNQLIKYDVRLAELRKMNSYLARRIVEHVDNPNHGGGSFRFYMRLAAIGSTHGEGERNESF